MVNTPSTSKGAMEILSCTDQREHYGPIPVSLISSLCKPITTLLRTHMAEALLGLQILGEQELMRLSSKMMGTLSFMVLKELFGIGTMVDFIKIHAELNVTPL